MAYARSLKQSMNRNSKYRSNPNNLYHHTYQSMINRWAFVLLMFCVVFTLAEIYHLTILTTESYFIAFLIAVICIAFSVLLFVATWITIVAFYDISSEIKDFLTGY